MPSVDWRHQQRVFTQFIRDPARNPMPAGIDPRRMNIYAELFYNNVAGLLASTFPVLREILDDGAWESLTRDYFHRHRAHTPLFPHMPKEFLQYLQEERTAPNDPPFLPELAHYEWTELALSIDPREISLNGIDPEGDLLAATPVISPLAWALSYHFPVHQIRPDFQPTEQPPTPTYLVVYRDLNDDVAFLELNPVSARLLELLLTPDAPSGEDCLRQIAVELRHPNPKVVIQGGLQILQDLRARSVILGTALGRS